MKGGEIPSQIPQRTSWIKEQMGMMKFEPQDIINHLTTLPVKLTLKGITSVKALAKSVARTTVNALPNVICCRIRVIVLGRPMKCKAQKKQMMGVMSKE